MERNRWEQQGGSVLLLGAPARDACAGDTQGRAHASERPARERTRWLLPRRCRFEKQLRPQ